MFARDHFKKGLAGYTSGRKAFISGDWSPLWFLTFALLAIALAVAAGCREMAVYMISFWHYLVYALAFFWRRIPQERFISDAVLLKMLSLAALVYVFTSTLPNALSLIVMAAGFALNIVAARALGTERTYYGFEIGGLPPKHVSAFPFGYISHPMLLGNMTAYAGMLLDNEFRSDWWPLGLLHIFFNFAILQMEIHGRKSRRLGMTYAIAGLLIGSIFLLFGYFDDSLFALSSIIVGLVFSTYLFHRYSELTHS